MLKIIRTEIEGQIGLDLVAVDESATIADLFVPLQEAADDPSLVKPDHKKRLAKCAGCDNNCCRRYAILPDLLTVRLLQKEFKLDLPAFTARFLRLEEDQPFAEFAGRGCPFLRKDLCSIYTLRPAFCRFYLCTPSGERLEKLKAQVLLLGEAALREYLCDHGLGPKRWHAISHRHPSEIRDSPQENPLRQATDYRLVSLRSCCSDQLWAWLQLNLEQAGMQTYEQWIKMISG